MYGLRLEDEETNMLLKLIGIVDALSMTVRYNGLKGNHYVEYNDCNGNAVREMMSLDKIDEYNEKIWNEII